jgi:putative heme-binding domain-containing protein
MRNAFRIVLLFLVAATAVVLAMALPAGNAAQEKKDPPPGMLAPDVAAKTFKTPDDLAFDQVLAEPIVRQPVSLSFDERGRLWVVQYIQYPHPAGLKVLSRDMFWRVVYDKVPPPPPNHFPGRDIISIHEDTQGNGVFDKLTVFLEGLNIVTSVARGRGGVWVLNPPYLLFYPTRDNADRPTGDPVVHLQGFGLEDTHSCANSLRWGPDGWLYGAHGSTVSANITRPGDKAPIARMVGQHIWRYHPEKKRFEIFAEGGGNAFGVEIDSQGRVYSGHNGGDTRGFHYVQGGAYRKGFEKHGVLANPYSFGFFEAMKANKSQRFSHTYAINEAPGLPAKYRGKMFAVEPLQGRVMMSEITADRSSFQTQDLDPVVTSTDTWFRPVDIKPAPDGSLFVADFYEAKIAHLGHNDGVIDRDTGRVYRLRAADAKAYKPMDLGKKTSAELALLLRSDNRWVRQTANRLLGDRRDPSVLGDLVKIVRAERGQTALEALWALNLCGGFDSKLALELVAHPEPAVRAWTVRLLADDHDLGSPVAAKVAELARTEPSVHVRSQWAASARRLPAAQCMRIVNALLQRDEDAADIHVPLLLWWAVEAHCEKDRDAVLELLRESPLWNARLVVETMLPRLMKRFAMAGAQKDLRTCVELFRLAPDREHGLVLLKGFEEAFKGRSALGLPAELIAEVRKLGGGSLAFGVRQGSDEALAKALATISSPKATVADRVELVEILGEAHRPGCVPGLLKLLAPMEPEPLRRAALGALSSYKDDEIGASVVRLLPQMTGDLRDTAESLLTSRRAWSNQLVAAVDAGKVEPKSLPTATLRKLLLHEDDNIAALVKKHWGDIKGATTAQMQHDIDRLTGVVSSGNGSPYIGKKLFTARCATCHVLHATGGTVGPDLTPFKRDDAAHLLLHVINPSAEIREGYENQIVATADGRTLTGIVIEKDARVVVLRSADGQRVVLPKDDIDDMRVSPISLMPEGLLQGLSDQEVRDLFAYLRSGQPLNERK